jgi:hypothetical protein
MAGTVVHLLIAERLLQKLVDRGARYSFDASLKPDQDYFIAGNICPDGIMARAGYQREMKLHTHFRDGIPDGSFDKPGMVPLFEKRLREFWEAHKRDERECPGLYLGYITHMMTDQRFILKERPKFFENISVIGLTEQDRETFIRFGRETDSVDFRLIREYPELREAYASLKRVKPYEIKGMITEEELTASRTWILGHFFEEEHEEGEPRFLEYGSMVQFIGEVTEEIVQRLLIEGYLN